jgi:hypothetical protein
MTHVPALQQPTDSEIAFADAAITRLIRLLAQQAAREMAKGAMFEEETTHDNAQQF